MDKDVFYIYIYLILFSHGKEGNPAICDNMDELWEPYTKWKKSDREKLIPCDTTYVHVCAKSLQSYPTLCDSMDCNSPGSSVLGILQARILEWLTMPCLQGIFPTQGSNLYLLWLLHGRRFFTTEPPGKPWYHLHVESKRGELIEAESRMVVPRG